MDIHSGGIDLAFPHHDNEMAQSEVPLKVSKPYPSLTARRRTMDVNLGSITSSTLATYT